MDSSPEAAPLTHRVRDVITENADRGPSTRALAIAAVAGLALSAFLLLALPGKPPAHEQPLAGPTTDVDALSTTLSTANTVPDPVTPTVTAESPRTGSSVDKASGIVASRGSADRAASPAETKALDADAAPPRRLSIVPVAAAQAAPPRSVESPPARVVNLQEIEPPAAVGATGRPAADLIVAPPIVRERETPARVPEFSSARVSSSPAASAAAAPTAADPSPAPNNE